MTDPAVTIINPDHLIATLTADVPFRVELSVESGRGYRTGAENRSPEQEVGVISTDSVFSPVRRVRFHTEDMRRILITECSDRVTHIFREHHLK